MTNQKTIHDAKTGETITRDFTADEIAQHEKDQADETKRKAQVEADTKLVEQKKQAIRDRLGLTADEVKLLLS